MLVEPMICKSGQPTQDGSRSSSIRTANSSTGPTIRFSMSREAKMRKDMQLVFGVTIEESINNGKLFILIKPPSLKPRDSTKNSDSTSTDHSILDQDCHSKELLSATVPTTSGSRDGERMSDNNNGTSTRSPRPSRTTTGSLTHLTSNPTVAPQTSDAPLPTQDGGRCSD